MSKADREPPVDPESPSTVVRTKKVTFDTTLPRGTVATFSHDGELWFAYPQKKKQAIFAVLDNLIGALGMVRDDLIRWINSHPEDAAHAALIVAKTDRGLLVGEKVKAVTM